MSRRSQGWNELSALADFLERLRRRDERTCSTLVGDCGSVERIAMPAQTSSWNQLCLGALLGAALAAGCSEGSSDTETPHPRFSGGTHSGGAHPGAGASGGTFSAGGTTGGSPGEAASGGSLGAPTGGAQAGGGQASGGQASAGSGGLGAGGDGAGGAPSGGDSAAALDALRDWLAGEPSGRAPLDEQGFASVPLAADDAAAARELLWNDLASRIRMERQTEVDRKSITIEGSTLVYETVLLGNEPEGGRSLFISMHGGGNAPKETNDQQWDNQILLAQSYAPEDTLWIAPRAPIDDWNMWFTADIPPLFDRLISNMIVFEGVNPDKVYITGYSAGGDGVYQLGPTMADRWAGAAMSAGHPNDMTPTNLRNLAFAIHVGGDDTAYDRNLVAAEWGEQLDTLQAADPDGYPHQVQVHAGLPHWMNLADQPSVPFIQAYTRDLYAKRVVWKQSTLLETRFYWLKIEPAQAVKNAEIVAQVDGQTVSLESEDLSQVTLRLSDQLLELDRDVTVTFNGSVVFEGSIARTILALGRSLAEREDPAATFSAELLVER